MKNYKLFTVYKVFFVIVVILTFVFLCGLIVGALHQDQTDDILGSFMTTEIGFVILFIVITEEFIVYRSVRFFLFEEKTPAKIIIYTMLLTLTSLLIGFEVAFVLSYF